jgi:hypothetical protein
VTDLSRRWELADVYDRLTNNFIQLANTPNGRQPMQQIRVLGALQSVRDFELCNYAAGTAGTTAAFSLKDAFENDAALVPVTVLKKSGTVRVHGFHVDPIPGGGICSPTRAQT